MASISEAEEILEGAVAGIPRVAELVASIPEGDRGRALDAAAQSYRETVRNLGHDQGPIQSWVSAVTVRLQTEVKKQTSTKPSPLKILHDELVPVASGLSNNVRDIGKSGRQ